MSTSTLRARVLDHGWTRERWFVILGAWLLLAPLVLPRFQVYLFTEFLIIALFATAFNLLYGYTGLLSFGHAMFFAAGGYGLAIVLQDVLPEIVAGSNGLAPILGLVLGGLVGLLLVFVLALFVGFLSVRLEEIYFALITLSFSMAFYALALQNVGGLTNGSDGIIVLLSSANIGGFELRLGGRTTYYYLVLIVVVPAMYGLWRIVHSPFGMVCRAMRESPDRAEAIGINVRYHQWVMFVISAVFAGLAGILIVPLYNVVSPALAHWTTSAIPVIAAVLGGAFYFLGPTVGAFAFLYLRWAITQHPTLEAHWELTFGIALIIVLLYFKEGVTGGIILARAWLANLAAVYRDDGVGGVRAFVLSTVQEKRQRMKSGFRRGDRGGERS